MGRNVSYLRAMATYRVPDHVDIDVVLRLFLLLPQPQQSQHQRRGLIHNRRGFVYNVIKWHDGTV
jgi:hypothetical protein